MTFKFIAMFERTRIKLTAWYLLIIMTISLLFSLIIYSLVNVEFVRFERMQERIQRNIEDGFAPAGPPRFEEFSFEDIHEARMRLVTRLGIMNLGILIFAGGAGYFLAGRTLRPIKETMEEQNRFISDSSHELRTPLTSLRSEIEVSLRDKKLNESKAKKVLESNLDEVISLQILSERLLELAENGNLTNISVMEKVSVLAIVRNALKKVSPAVEKKKIKIAFHPKEGKLEVLGIPDRLTEVFVILLDNAIKYSPKKAEIVIESRKTNGKVEISVIDHGIGITEEELPHIFDRFFRGDKSRTEDGYGLGLSIAKKIVETHRGSINVESRLKKGTTFTVIFPA